MPHLFFFTLLPHLYTCANQHTKYHTYTHRNHKTQDSDSNSDSDSDTDTDTDDVPSSPLLPQGGGDILGVDRVGSIKQDTNIDTNIDTRS